MLSQLNFDPAKEPRRPDRDERDIWAARRCGSCWSGGLALTFQRTFPELVGDGYLNGRIHVGADDQGESREEVRLEQAGRILTVRVVLREPQIP